MSTDARVVAASRTPADDEHTTPTRRNAELVSRTVAVRSLDLATRHAAFELFRASYANTSRERFESDLAEKRQIILLRDRASGVLKGFSTVHVGTISTPRGLATLVFSGDTVIDREYWGQKQLQLAFARLVVSYKLRAPWRPVYWFLISKGYRTYLLMANSFPRSFPRCDRDEDRMLRTVLDDVATKRFGADYDVERGLVRYATPHDRVRDCLAPVTEGTLANPHVRFFIERNPEHTDGVELACLADIRVSDLARAVWRIVAKKRRRRASR